MIPNLTIGDLIIDCADAERTCDFYANLTGWAKTVAHDRPAIKTIYGIHILFAQPDIPHVPPVWPEEPGKQQKQMHLDFVVDDLPSAVEKAIRLGATKAAEQYGDYYITMLDPDGHPFCLCRRSENKSDFDLYFDQMGYGAIPDLSIMIDCKKTDKLRDFYARLTDWDQGFHSSVLLGDNKMILCFMECDGDFDYVPPAYPDKSGQQQKQMYFNFYADDLPSAVEEAIRIGATKAAGQNGNGQTVMLIDTEGHPFCLCARNG